jgi:hypothetical protein
MAAAVGITRRDRVRATVVFRPGQHGVAGAGELGAIVRDDHDRLAPESDQRRQFAPPAVPIEVSGIAARRSHVTSSTIFRIRKRRPLDHWRTGRGQNLATRAFGRASTRIGARVPTARRRGRRLRKLRPSSPAACCRAVLRIFGLGREALLAIGTVNER